MKVLNLLWCLFWALSTYAHSQIQLDLEVNQENRCGGAIEADSGSLVFPLTGQVVQPGDTCIWTIHLQHTSAVRFNFSSLDIIGNEPDCGDSGVRLYSLTNLLPVDKAQNYTFCNNQPPSDNSFFLVENLIAVVYHASENFTNSGSGFTLNWEGLSFNPYPKEHRFGFLSETSGVIRYPVQGGYSPNRISTWVVETRPEDETSQLQIDINYVNLEQCNEVDPCVCDALIIYQVSSSGILQENKRLCGNATDTEIQGIGRNFIVGFYTNGKSVERSGPGFELIYMPLATPTMETPPPTTTPPPHYNTTTSCGGVVGGDQGLISYKLGEDERYEPLGNCIWTIRVPNYSAILLTVSPVSFPGVDNDLLTFYSVTPSGIMKVWEVRGNHASPTKFQVNSSVVHVDFFSDRDSYPSDKGFSIEFEAVGELDNSVMAFRDVNVVTISDDRRALKHPSENNLEFSTFVFTTPSGSPRYTISFNFTSLSLERASNATCIDKLRIYYTLRGYIAMHQHTPDTGICSLSQFNSPPYTTESVILVLATNEIGTGDGFEVEWQRHQEY